MAKRLAMVGFLAGTASSSEASERGPEATVLHAADILRAGQAAKRGSDFDALVDHRELAKRVLGIHYPGLTSNQKSALTAAIRAYAAASCRRYKALLRDFKIDCHAQRVSAVFAEVGCQVEHRGQLHGITLLLRRGKSWRVYDVQGPQFGLIRDNASSADRVIRREGFDGYLRRLQNGAHQQRNAPPPTRIGE